MDKARLRHLAGMKHTEGSGSNYEVLEEAPRGEYGRIDTVRNVAYKMHAQAEDAAFNEAEEGRQSVGGDEVYAQYEKLKAQMDQYVQELINKGEQG